jgi:hypothetical protein
LLIHIDSQVSNQSISNLIKDTSLLNNIKNNTKSAEDTKSPHPIQMFDTFEGGSRCGTRDC